MATSSVDDDLQRSSIDDRLDVEVSRPWRQQERGLNHCHKRLGLLHLHSLAGAWTRAQGLPFLPLIES